MKYNWRTRGTEPEERNKEKRKKKREKRKEKRNSWNPKEPYLVLLLRIDSRADITLSIFFFNLQFGASFFEMVKKKKETTLSGLFSCASLVQVLVLYHVYTMSFYSALAFFVNFFLLSLNGLNGTTEGVKGSF